MSGSDRGGRAGTITLGELVDEYLEMHQAERVTIAKLRWLLGKATAALLQPSELFALEQRDIDRALGVVYVRRAYANGRLKHTKTRLSTRAVPLQAIGRGSNLLEITVTPTELEV